MAIEPKLTKQSEAILAKLNAIRGPNRLTAEEIERIRNDFLEEDRRRWALKFWYNFLIKSASILTAIGAIGTAFLMMRGWVKL